MFELLDLRSGRWTPALWWSGRSLAPRSARRLSTEMRRLNYYQQENILQTQNKDTKKYLQLQSNHRWKHLRCRATAVVQLMTWGDVVLGPVAVSFDEHGGGEEETSTDDGDEGAEQQRELQRAKLPEERVRLPQRVRNLRDTRTERSWNLLQQTATEYIYSVTDPKYESRVPVF